MVMHRVIRTLTPVAAVALVTLVLLSIYRGVSNLPPATMVAITPMTGAELAVNEQPLPEKLGVPHIIIHKSRRRLELYDGDVLLRVHPIARGRSPKADKVREGDGATPEGVFYVCTRNPESRYDRFLGISYPSAEDADRGRHSGLIDNGQHRMIMQALDNGRRPPWNTPLGGEIGIHGGGNSRDWTLGSVALTDEAVAELFDVLPFGTVVAINP